MAIGGVVIPAGETVFMAISPASREHGGFPDPDRLDPSRDTSGHLAFGRGIHYCLGASLARAGAGAALGALQRMAAAVLALSYSSTGCG